MRIYLNDSSLQGQFENAANFLEILQGFLEIRARYNVLRESFFVVKCFADRPVNDRETVRQAIASASRDQRAAIFAWLGKAGPFVEDSRQPEEQDYFECFGVDVTDGGLGEVGRRVKAQLDGQSFSFSGGTVNFTVTPLPVEHGIPEDRLGSYNVENYWDLVELTNAARALAPEITSWRELIIAARERFPKLWIPDSVFEDARLAREPFDGPIRDRTIVLLTYLNEYMEGRQADGSEGAISRSVVERFFTGDRALFSGESVTNQRDFVTELSFDDPENQGHKIFAHWHGKISHRFFRMHFEWPVPNDASRLKVLYLGPKLTKS
ncbi:hypothetical protein GCM10027321_22410 [Massilia terrae]|uniref:Uncharacterized protein n=1 Tax=Massilia terrae TaxID=1811224 RepID=A0ABT2CY15_9BURK|nr:hypothetical protein [Massilia terrae]MCS0658867.1 hypothetical protein [Massilia terrae]